MVLVHETSGVDLSKEVFPGHLEIHSLPLDRYSLTGRLRLYRHTMEYLLVFLFSWMGGKTNVPLGMVSMHASLMFYGPQNSTVLRKREFLTKPCSHTKYDSSG